MQCIDRKGILSLQNQYFSHGGGCCEIFNSKAFLFHQFPFGNLDFQVVQPPTPSSSNECLTSLGYEFQFYCGAGSLKRRRDSREETLANIMRHRSAGEQVCGSSDPLLNQRFIDRVPYVFFPHICITN